MTDNENMTIAQRAIGDFAPKLVELTDGVLFGDVWEREELSKRDRSLSTVAALVAGGNIEQLRNHLLRRRGVSDRAGRTDYPFTGWFARVACVAHEATSYLQ
jgi:4-carboxymuconolactone decarboxylase